MAQQKNSYDRNLFLTLPYFLYDTKLISDITHKKWYRIPTRFTHMEIKQKFYSEQTIH
jgi:hypothetical protein